MAPSRQLDPEAEEFTPSMPTLASRGNMPNIPPGSQTPMRPSTSITPRIPPTPSTPPTGRPIITPDSSTAEIEAFIDRTSVDIENCSDQTRKIKLMKEIQILRAFILRRERTTAAQESQNVRNKTSPKKEDINKEKTHAARRGKNTMAKTYCECGKPGRFEMVQCFNDRCQMKWFHWSCVDKRSDTRRLEEVKLQNWVCKDCAEAVKLTGAFPGYSQAPQPNHKEREIWEEVVEICEAGDEGFEIITWSGYLEENLEDFILLGRKSLPVPRPRQRRIPVTSLWPENLTFQ